MKTGFLATMLLLLTSCASTMPGKDLNLKSTFLHGTIKENKDFSSEKIKMYQVSLKNLSKDWISVDSVLMSNTINTKILLGEKVTSWIEACTLEKKVYDYNLALAFGAVAATGAIVGVTSSNSTTSSVGSVTALGAIGASGIKEFMETKNKAEFQATLPEGHLFRSFIIPPLKVTQRWILIERFEGETPAFTLISKDKTIGEVSFSLPYEGKTIDDYPEEKKR